jgi:hypothetical protein
MNKPEDEINQDADSFVEYLLETQIAKLNNLTNFKNFALYTGYFSTLFFLFLLIFKVNNGFSWFYLLPIALTSILAFSTFFNVYLKLQDFFQQELAKLKNQDLPLSLGSWLSYLSLNIAVICLSVYFILISLKLTQIIATEWNILAIPMIILFCISLIYIIFIMPAFIANRLYLEIALVFVYLVSAILFMFFLNLRLDRQITTTFLQIFLPLIISLSLNFVYCVFKLFNNKVNNGLKTKLVYLVSIILLLVASITASLKLDGEIQMPGYVPVLLSFFAVLMLIHDDLAALFIQKEEEEELFDKV